MNKTAPTTIRWSRMLAIVMAGAILGGLAGAVCWFVLPTEYRSYALVEVTMKDFRTEGIAETKESLMKVEHKGNAVTASFDSFLLATRVATRLGGGHTPVEIAKRIRAKVDNISVVKVSAAADSPEEAQHILQAVLDEQMLLEKENFAMFMQPLLQGIDRQLEELRQNIAAILQQIATYAGDKPDLESRRISGTGQATIEGDIAQLAVDTEAARIRVERLGSLISQVESGKTLTESIQDFGEWSYTFSDLKRQLADRSSALASLRSRYGDGNPRVEAAKAEWEETKRLVTDALRELKHQVDTKYAGLQAARKSLEKGQEALTKQMTGTLDRDPVYSTLVTSKDSMVLAYQTLLVRKHELAVTSQLEPVTLKVIDVPDLPRGPYLIIKLLLLAGALVVGTTAGAALALLRSGILPQILDLPVRESTASMPTA